MVPADVLQRAIDQGWSRQRAGVAFLEAVRDRRGAPLGGDVPLGGRAPAGHSRTNDLSSSAIAAALMMRGSTGGNGQAGRRIDDPVRRRFVQSDDGDMRFVDASRDDAWCRAVELGYRMRGLSQVELARRALELDGIRVDPTPSAIVGAFQNRSTAASINAFLGIYTQTFGALLLSSFEQTRDTTEAWCVERDNPNFLQNERHRLRKGSNLTKHAKGGEADHFAQDDVTEYTKVHRYSGQSVFDEIDLVNDTMFNALRTATPEEMGESARRLRPDLVYAILMSNPNLADSAALFNSTFGNIKFSHPFNKANLQSALTTIATRQENGVNLNLEGKFVITPTALMFDVADLIRADRLVIAGDTDRTLGNYNVLSTLGLQPVSDSRLDNGVTDPNSGTAIAGDVDDWYVAAAPGRHTIEVTYLRGSSRVPQLRSGILDRGQWGIWFDVKHDIGAKALARHGMVKCTPSAS